MEEKDMKQKKDEKNVPENNDVVPEIDELDDDVLAFVCGGTGHEGEDYDD